MIAAGPPRRRRPRPLCRNPALDVELVFVGSAPTPSARQLSEGRGSHVQIEARALRAARRPRRCLAFPSVAVGLSPPVPGATLLGIRGCVRRRRVGRRRTAGWTSRAPLGDAVRSPGDGNGDVRGRGAAAGGGTVLAVTVVAADGLTLTLLPLERAAVAAGDTVSEGDALGEARGRGRRSCSSPHVHLSARRGELYVDPRRCWRPRRSRCPHPNRERQRSTRCLLRPPRRPCSRLRPHASSRTPAERARPRHGSASADLARAGDRAPASSRPRQAGIGGERRASEPGRAGPRAGGAGTAQPAAERGLAAVAQPGSWLLRRVLARSAASLSGTRWHRPGCAQSGAA